MNTRPMAADAAPTAENTDWRVPVSRTYIARDFRFHSGEAMAELKLAYTVLGNPEGEPVLLLHGTGGSGSGLLSRDFGGELFGPGQPLDAARHFIILPDSIGHGASAKPSDGMRMAFPRYSYDDMVEGQYRLLTEALGVRRLRLVLGVSMGGMHAWLWGIRYPGFMDALVPMASLPVAMSGRNWMLRRLFVDAIRNDPQWHGGNYTEQPSGVRAAWEFLSVASNGGTLALHSAAPDSKAADVWLANRREAPFRADANDLLYQWESSRDYDPSAELEQIRSRVLAINSTDDERNPPELARRAIRRIPKGRLFEIPGDEHTRGHSTIGRAKLWAQELTTFLDSLPGSLGRETAP